MSGGHFDYKQYAIRDLIESLEALVHEKVDEEFRNVVITAVHHLKYSYEYVHALDYYLSGDYSWESAKKKLDETIPLL